MRVTNEMMVTSSLRRLSTRMAQYEGAQSQMATGKLFTKPSQDPARANTGLTLRQHQSARAQEDRAAADASTWMDIVDSQMQTAVARLHRARDLMVDVGPNFSQTERDAMAVEVETVRSEMVGLANARHRGRPLFSGFTDAAPVTGGPGAWVITDDGGQVMRRVGEQDDVRINVLATELFEFAGGTDDVFTLLDDVADDMRTNGGTGLQPMLARMDAALEQIASQQGRVGATANHVESATSRSMDVQQALRVELAKTEDVEYARAVMDLQVQELGFQATLGALGRALPPTLLNFVR